MEGSDQWTGVWVKGGDGHMERGGGGVEQRAVKRNRWMMTTRMGVESGLSL